MSLRCAPRTQRLTCHWHYPGGVTRHGSLIARRRARARAGAAPAAAARRGLARRSTRSAACGSATPIDDRRRRHRGRGAARRAHGPARGPALPVRRRLAARGRPHDRRRRARSPSRAELDRNHQVRVRLVGRPPATPDVPPSTAARPRRLRPARVHARLRAARRRRDPHHAGLHACPSDVRAHGADALLRRPVQAGRGRCTAKRAPPFRPTAETRRCARAATSRGRRCGSRASFDGRFRYVSCFRYSPGSGMGDPDLRCPKKRARLR